MQLRLLLIKLMPFMARWQDSAPAACCGVCGPCLTATATGLSLEVIGVAKSDDEPDAHASDSEVLS
jgi:hypothetical protein